MPRPIAPRPYPFQPVQDLMNLHGISDSELGIWTGALNLRAARRKVQRWKVAGLTESQADAVACALHCHPAEVWQHYWWTLAPMVENESEDSSIHTEGACNEPGLRLVPDPEPDVERERP